jgi:hypothetical protein
MSRIRSQFLQFLHQKFPALSPERADPLIAENLLAETVVDLPASVLKQAQGFVEAAFSLRLRPEYQEVLRPEREKHGLKETGNFSIAMSYDFHLNEDGVLKLIEVNTNAAFLALGDLLYQSQNLPPPVADFSFDEIRKDLLNELRLVGKTTESPKVLIVDEEPDKQRLFIEFLVYQEIFRSWGWATEIRDTRESGLSADLIYNRDTDFYLEKPELKPLKEAWLSRKFCLTPNPVEYLYLADKERQIQWNEPGFLERMGLMDSQIQALRKRLPFATALTSENADELWDRRKTLFLKPQRSFGAKQSYRGGSISRRIYDELIGQDILAQEFVPAPEIEIETPGGPQKMKYDLRFYAYQGRVQTVMARLYQGQVTNLRTPHGGFACVQFKN